MPPTGSTTANGWVKAKDARGRTFYANLSTRKTQWTKPDDWPHGNDEGDDDDEGMGTGGGGGAAGDGGGQQEIGGGSSGGLRSGFSPTSSTTTQSPSATRRTSAPASDLRTMPAGITNSGSGEGRSNTTTTSQRDQFRRAQSARVGVSKTKPSSRYPPAGLTRGSSNAAAFHHSFTEGMNLTEEEPTGAVDEDGNPPLPSNWEVMHDPTSGRPFYVDHVNRKTTWEHPGLTLAKAAAASKKTTTTARPTSSTSSSSKATAATTSGGGGGFGAVTTGFLKSNNNSSSSSSSYAQVPSSSAAAPSSSFRGRSSSPVAPRSTAPNTKSTSSSNSNNDSYSHWAGATIDGSHDIPTNSDYGGAPPEFKVVHVADEQRSECPGCGVYFSIPLRRRHHCRLCGDVFCDACSNHRCQLPLDGTEFERPVRVCDLCHADVERGNYFSMRRYLSALQLFDPETSDVTDPDGVAARNIAGALASLSSDLDAVLLDSTSFEEKVTLPASILVPAIGKHLHHPLTSDRAVRALATLLALGSVVADNSFAHEVYLFHEGEYVSGGADQGGRDGGSSGGGEQGDRGEDKQEAAAILDSIMKLLEQSGSDRHVLMLQEQAARAMFYLSDPGVISTLLTLRPGKKSANGSRRRESVEELDEDAEGEGSGGNKREIAMAARAEQLDVHRALRNMLDHAISSSSPSLQRWAAASIRNLIAEDQRRACSVTSDKKNDNGEGGSGEEASVKKYDSFTAQLVSTGGVMILCSLMGADDADTRAHATAALSATIAATRAIDEASAPSQQRSRYGGSMSTKSNESDAKLVTAIVESGGCGSTLSQLLLSADNTVAGMGCTFASALVRPLLQDPAQCLQSSGASEKLSAYRDAALAIVKKGGCLPALIQLARDTGGRSGGRPMELKKCAMETIAAVCLAVQYCHQQSGGGSSDVVRSAVRNLEEEGIAEVTFSAFGSSSPSSLSSSRNSPSSQLREAAGIALGGLLSFSSHSAVYVQSKHGVLNLLSAAGEEGMLSPSPLRGEWAPRCLGIIEAASVLATQVWGRRARDKSSKSKALDCLLETLDAGAVPLLSRIMSTNIEFHRREKSVGDATLMAHACRLASAMFGIANADETVIGRTRLYDAIATDAEATLWGGHQSSGRTNLITATAAMLLSMSSSAQSYGDELPLLGLVAALLIAVGSMCGAATPHDYDETLWTSADFEISNGKEAVNPHAQDCCVNACATLLDDGNSLLPSMLIGAYGEGCLDPALRLSLAMTLNGPDDLYPRLAQCGLLIPVADILQAAFQGGNRYRFSASLALLRYCGPFVAAEAGEKGGLLSSVRQSIESMAGVMLIPEESGADPSELHTVRALKAESVSALESMSKNAALWSVIASVGLPSISEYMMLHQEWYNEDSANRSTLCAALRTVQNVTPLPSHAVAAARCGIGESLSKLIVARKDNVRDVKAKKGKGFYREKQEQENLVDVPLVALDVLRSLAANADARMGDGKGFGGLIRCGAVDAACFSLGESALMGDKGAAGAVAKLSLEILHYFANDLDQAVHGDARKAFVRSVSTQPLLILALCSTLLQGHEDVEFEPKAPSVAANQRTGSDAGSKSRTAASLYGAPLPLLDETCAGFPNMEQAVVAILFSFAAHCTIAGDEVAFEGFWDTFLLRQDRRIVDKTTKRISAASACVAFLQVLMDEDSGICIPRNSSSLEFFFERGLPAVRMQLLEGLKQNILPDEPTKGGRGGDNSAIVSMIEGYGVPNMCLDLALRSPTLVGPVCELIESVGELSKDVLHATLSDEPSLKALFDLVNAEDCIDASTRRLSQRLFCKILCDFARQGTLGPLIERYDMRQQAILSLCAACEDEEDGPVAPSGANVSGNNEMCMWSLLSILLPTTDDSPGDGSDVHLDPEEASVVATSLGRTVSSMVISRFMDRASAQGTDLHSYRTDLSQPLLTAAPEAKLLCALAVNEHSLPILCRSGGLEALSLIVTEGEPLAIKAMLQQAQVDPTAIIDVECHVSVMELLSHECSSLDASLTGSCLELLATLSRSSRHGRLSIAGSELSDACVEAATTLLRRSLKETVSASATGPGVGGGAPIAATDIEESHLAELGGDESEKPKEDLDAATADSSEDPDEVDDSPDADTEKEEGPPSFEDINLPPPCVENLCTFTSPEGDDIPQVIGAIGFLAEMVQTSQHQKSILGSKSVLDAAAFVCTEDDTPQELAYQATAFLVMVSHGLSWRDWEGAPAFSFADLFTSIMLKDTDFFPYSEERCRLLAAAAEGLECILDSVQQVKELVKALAFHFLRLLECLETPSSVVDGRGLLACNITTLFLLLGGDPSHRSFLIESPALSGMLKLVSMLLPPGGEGSDDDSCYWKTAQTQSLQCIASVLRADCIRSRLVVSLEEVFGGGDEDVSSQIDDRDGGNAPESAPYALREFISMLDGMQRETKHDPVSAVAARRVLHWLGHS